jgi:hypothetical protein
VALCTLVSCLHSGFIRIGSLHRTHIHGGCCQHPSRASHLFRHYVPGIRGICAATVCSVIAYVSIKNVSNPFQLHWLTQGLNHLWCLAASEGPNTRAAAHGSSGTCTKTMLVTPLRPYAVDCKVGHFWDPSLLVPCQRSTPLSGTSVHLSGYLRSLSL